MKLKDKIYKIKSINEAIDRCHQFFDCDMYSKFRPEAKIQNESWFRKDIFRNEKEFMEYLDSHFKILKNEIKRVNKHDNHK